MKMLDWVIQELNKLDYDTKVSGYTLYKYLSDKDINLIQSYKYLSDKDINLIQSYLRLLAWSGFIGNGSREYNNTLTYTKYNNIPTFLTVKKLNEWYRIPYEKEIKKLIAIETRKYKIKKLIDVTL